MQIYMYTYISTINKYKLVSTLSRTKIDFPAHTEYTEHHLVFAKLLFLRSNESCDAQKKNNSRLHQQEVYEDNGIGSFAVFVIACAQAKDDKIRATRCAYASNQIAQTRL